MKRKWVLFILFILMNNNNVKCFVSLISGEVKEYNGSVKGIK